MKEFKATRTGYGDGLVEAAKKDKNVVALSADLRDSVGMSEFAKLFPERFIEVGVAEQNLVTVASGLAQVGKKPFASSFAAFSPGRNWEQIRTTICYNNQPVVIASTHSGLGVGEDGATHQMLEDIAMMRTLPNMQVIVPCDSEEAKKATLELAKSKQPAYLRLGRQKVETITKERNFKIGKADILREGKDITIIACGPMVHEALKAHEELKKKKISVEIINLHTIKPIDKETIIESAKKTKKIITIEDHQINGGLGSAVAEVVSQNYPVKIKILGVKDVFGESGTQEQLYEKYGLTSKHIIKNVLGMMKK